MNKSIPREFIDKLIEMSDIVGIIGTYVDLRQSSGQYRSKCPFHDGDNITTFSVSPQKGIYHCFKCNEGGNVISFLMKYLSLDFIEAVEKLAEINHVEIPRTATKQGPDNSKFFEINKLVANEYFANLKNEPVSVEYVKGPPKILSRFFSGSGFLTSISEQETTASKIKKYKNRIIIGSF